MINLSPSKLNILKDCECCFYNMMNNNVPRPRGIFPSLPSGIDSLIKDHVDSYRGKLPPELVGKLPGALYPDFVKLSKWRNWRSGLVVKTDEYKLIGAIDDLLIDGDIHIIIDFKSKGSEPATSGAEYYQTQLDCYNFMFRKNGMKTADKSYLIYLYPKTSQPMDIDKKEDLDITFGVSIKEIATSADNAEKFINYAVKILKGKRPEPSAKCEYCNFSNGILQLTKGILPKLD